MKRISKQELAHNLDAAIGAQVGMKGLQTLLYGWMNYRKYGKKYRKAIYNRSWLYIVEALDFSEYAGYDLTFFPS